jgi:hypothetical protein
MTIFNNFFETRNNVNFFLSFEEYIFVFTDVHVYLSLRPRALEFLQKCKAITVTDRGGPFGFETSRLPHFLDNRFADGVRMLALRAG